MLRPFRAIALLLVCVLPAFAFAQQTQLSETDETRARALFTELRCVVCQNQSIDSSDADVAKDLRQIVREQIASGKSNGEIRDYLVARYGEFILLKPAFAWHTLILWFAPILALGTGIVVSLRMLRKPNSGTDKKLSSQEEAEIQKILSGNSPD